MLLREIARHTPCACYCEDALAEAPPDVEVRDPVQAFRHLGPHSRILHHVGNNRGHVFVLNALRRFGGVTSLHDLSLLYVNELDAAKPDALFGRMKTSSPALGDVYARHWRDNNFKTSANYVLFDMVDEILDTSDHVIVHSDFARKKLIATYGAGAGEKLTVIPHFAKPIPAASSRQARLELGLDPATPLILTSGFATNAKRFDWLIAAVADLRREGRAFRWIHAGEERPAEYPLSKEIQAHSDLSEVCTVTGYLSEDKLDRYIAAADIVVNLRFPSVGESSGTLARAFSAGRCCVVSDTAAYSEIPRDTVVHIPLFDSSPALRIALDALLSDRALRETFGRRARQYARTTLSIESIAQRYLAVVEHAQRSSRSKRQPIGAVNALSERGENAAPTVVEWTVDDHIPALSSLIKPPAADFQGVFWFTSADHFAKVMGDSPATVTRLSSPEVEIKAIGFSGSMDASRIGLRIAGYIHR
ncbi:MAG: glycosyltransferase family 4 protein [Rhizobiales bacterium]|nr:glycosyltransferase family 4 protein [Hyphomicrobiales bacterium]